MKKTILKSVGYTFGLYLTFFVINFLIPWRDHQAVIQLGLLIFFALAFLPAYFFLKGGDEHPWWYIVFVLIADILLAGATFHIIPFCSDGWDSLAYVLLLLFLQYYFAAILLIDGMLYGIKALKKRKN